MALFQQGSPKILPHIHKLYSPKFIRIELTTPEGVNNTSKTAKRVGCSPGREQPLRLSPEMHQEWRKLGGNTSATT